MASRVDIIMPLYNKAAYVGRAIRSIQQQRMEDWHLIVIDDGSTDEGPSIVKAINDDRIEIIRQENCGPGAARNAGLLRTHSDYIAFLDSDDEWLPSHLENTLCVMKEHDSGMAATMFCEEPPIRNIKKLYSRRGVLEGTYELTGNEPPHWVGDVISFFSCRNSTVRSDLARQYGGFFGRKGCVYGEDAIFFMRILFNSPFSVIGTLGAIYHTEASDLCIMGRAHPPIPFLEDPNLVLSHCPEEKRNLMKGVLDYYALKCTRNWSRHGMKKEARALFKAYPGIRQFGMQYYRCRLELILSRWLPYWVRLKCRIGPPVRLYLRSLFSNGNNTHTQ